MPANLENSAMATGLEKVSFHSNPKEGLNCDIRWITEKASTFQKNIYLCFIDYTKAFDCVDHNKLGKVLQEMGIPDHLTCLLRSLHAGQEATVRTDIEQQTGYK